MGARLLRALTLVEVMIVIALLAILAAIAAPRFMHVGQAARASTLQFNIALIQSMIEYHSDGTGPHGHPTEISPEWFRSGKLPVHPESSAKVPSIEVVEQPLFPHPQDKVLTPHSAGAYWYNSARGVIRARVADQGSYEETLKFYNLVNQSDVTSLGNY